MSRQLSVNIGIRYSFCRCNTSGIQIARMAAYRSNIAKIYRAPKLITRAAFLVMKILEGLNNDMTSGIKTLKKGLERHYYRARVPTRHELKRKA